jgi:hypothetical protein
MGNNVDKYISKQKSPQKEICKKLRKIFLKSFPKIKEEMRVGVPYYDNKFYIVALKDHVNFGFEIKNFSKEEIKEFAGSGKTVKVVEIYSINKINEEKIVAIIRRVLN